MMIDRNGPLPESLAQLPDSAFEPAENRENIRDEAFVTEPIGFYRDALQRLRRSKVSIISFWIIFVIVVLALIVPEVTGYTYTQQNTAAKDLPPKIPGIEKLGIFDGTKVLTNRKKSSLDNPKRFPEGCVLEIVREYEAKGVAVVDVKVDYYAYCGIDADEYHWFGTDYLGRDILTRLFHGARISLLISLLSVVTNLIIGIIYGSVAGYYGGKVDMFLTHLAEVLDGLPYLVVTILFMLLLGSGMFSIVLALTVTGAIFSESFLAYIGLGIKPPEPSIGVLLSTGQSVLLQYPYQTLFPAILISVLMVAFNMLSNGLRDALDPNHRGEE